MSFMGNDSSHPHHSSSRSGNHTVLQRTKSPEAAQSVPIIDGRLYFMVTRYRPKNTDTVHFFTVDHLLKYEPFFVDFGPLNLGCLYKFCVMLKHKLKDARYKDSRIYYYTDKDPQKVANASYMIGAFQIIELSRHPSEAYSRIRELSKQAVPFRDASMGICTYRCTVEDCIWGIYRAFQRSFINFSTFNVDEYEYYERVEYGDLNVLIPNKFIAFAGPHYKEFDDEGYPALTPDFYIPIWKKFAVTDIIRLNKKCYDKRIWTRAGFNHHDLYFIDGTTPPDHILRKFIDICENAKGVIAVHCKAGLGRTGSCIGCFLMKHFCWTAQETIAWLRVCRPGSVIGPQQHFLEEQQSVMWKLGDEYRKKHGLSLQFDPRLEPKEEVKTYKASHHHAYKNHRSGAHHHHHGGNSNSGGGGGGSGHHSSHNSHRSPQQHTTVKPTNPSSSNHHTSSKNNPSIQTAHTEAVPLPTDPGQDQGRALINAKRKQRKSNPSTPVKDNPSADADDDMKGYDGVPDSNDVAIDSSSGVTSEDTQMASAATTQSGTDAIVSPNSGMLKNLQQKLKFGFKS